MAFNWKLIIILLAICAGLVLLVDVTVADESTATIIPDTTATVPEPIPMIQQGDVVYIGDTVDVSGFCGGYIEVAYWDGYDMYDETPTYNVTFANGKKAYTNFYVDPAIFEGKYGRWYKYNRKYESRSNNLAFIVAPKEYRNVSTTFQNGTVLYANQTQEYEYPKMSFEEKFLPMKPVNDYIISSEEYFNLSADGLSALWLFDKQSNNIIYTTISSGDLVISAYDIQSLLPGNYKILIQGVKNNATDFDVIYDKEDRQIKWFDKKSFVVWATPTDNLVPDEVIKRLEVIFPKTHDTYTIKTLVISDPEITINSMQEIYIGAAKALMRDSGAKGNVSVMEVKGYTNVRSGVNISITLDEDTIDPRDIKRQTYYTTAVGDDLGEWRQYRVFVPLYWDSLMPGMHKLVARTDIGGSMNADFPVIEMPADSYQPPEVVRWAGDENPWKANLTTNVVTVVQTQEVIKEVIKEVGPTDDQVYAQQKKVEEERFNWYIEIAKWVFGGIALFAILGYAAVVVYRGRKE